MSVFLFFCCCFSVVVFLFFCVVTIHTYIHTHREREKEREREREGERERISSLIKRLSKQKPSVTHLVNAKRNGKKDPQIDRYDNFCPACVDRYTRVLTDTTHVKCVYIPFMPCHSAPCRSAPCPSHAIPCTYESLCLSLCNALSVQCTTLRCDARHASLTTICRLSLCCESFQDERSKNHAALRPFLACLFVDCLIHSTPSGR
ncbi:hypothetical protein JOL62DRAFT_266253 [Phyllosticta paracitricarpa]|uniref:Uncharacterized protein n=1 Tax=Phyllosticta paracitricarpa TaxID=2016321 RepID=A0ABR1MXC9_9PEZI